MTWAILVGNIKGGTGKSTISQELAYALRDEGHNIGVLDADIDSANLASRFGTDEMVSFEGDHMIKPVQVDGISLYSMENAFDDSSFSQSGEFMGDVVADMVTSSNWGNLDYLVVDCPPGSSDVFESLVRALRANILGMVSVGISDAADDTGRLVRICNHNWVPILGFVENMSGVYCHGGEVTCENTEGEEHTVAPFGQGATKQLCDSLGGTYFGGVPLCGDETEISDAASETIDSIVEGVEDADEPELPEDNIGDKSFIRNLWGGISSGIKEMNNNIPVDQIQERFGVEGREPLIIKLELTDAGPITGLFSSVVLTVDDGRIKVMKPGQAKRKGVNVEAGMKISSQDLADAIKGEKKVMRSVNGEIATEPYSIIDAVKMGDAEVWGDKVINRLSVLDKILSEVVDMNEIQKAMAEA